MKIPRAVNGPKTSIFDELLCLIGIHTFHSVYVCYDPNEKETGNYGRTFDVCTCGYCHPFGNSEPIIFRTRDQYGYKKWRIRNFFG